MNPAAAFHAIGTSTAPDRGQARLHATENTRYTRAQLHSPPKASEGMHRLSTAWWSSEEDRDDLQLHSSTFTPPSQRSSSMAQSSEFQPPVTERSGKLHRKRKQGWLRSLTLLVRAICFLLHAAGSTKYEKRLGLLAVSASFPAYRPCFDPFFSALFGSGDDCTHETRSACQGTYEMDAPVFLPLP